MKITILILLYLLLSGCGKIEVEDSTHTVVHTIDLRLDELRSEIRRACEETYNTGIEIDQCVAETLDSILATIRGYQTNQQ